MRCFCRTVLAVAVCVLLAAPASSTIIDGYTPSRHDRFSSGSYGGGATLNTNAFFAGYDFSGVGRAGNQPVTMITPVHGVASAHSAPSGTVTFVNATGGLVTRSVASTQTVQDGTNANAQTDLALITLDAPLVATDQVTHYSLTFPTGRFGNSLAPLDQVELFVYGNQHAVGRNHLDGDTHFGSNFYYVNVGSATGVAAIYDYDPAAGFSPDESQLVSGDSGHPDFIPYNGELVLASTHWAIGSSPGGIPGAISTYVPFYAPEIAAFVDVYNTANGTSHALSFTDVLAPIPEPGTFLLLSFALGALSYRSRSRHRESPRSSTA